jgi:hypothetical protein
MSKKKKNKRFTLIEDSPSAFDDPKDTSGLGRRESDFSPARVNGG